MKIIENYSLKELNTYGVAASARYYANIEDTTELVELLNDKKYTGLPLKILGGGSNVLFVHDFPGIVAHLNLRGRAVVYEDAEKVHIECAAGESWHDFVTYAVENEFEGVENMALIPGTIGGAVVGNIAAYGQNLSDVILSVKVLNTKTNEVLEMSKEELRLRYRDSIFKERRELIILSATFELKKQYEQLETSYHERKGRYGSLEEELQSFSSPPYTIKDVYNAVIRQRTKRLPSVEEVGNAGSFFVNPIITKEKFEELYKKIPELQSYPAEDLKYTRKDWEDVKDQYVKIPAGRVIEFLGWRGKWEGNVGISEKHALCVVTNKQATGEEVLAFTEKVKKDVLEKYGIELKSEIDIIQ